MYVNPNPYALSETLKMHEHCSHCGLRYKMEPNFFFGAMFVSYGVAVGLGMLVFGLTFLVFKTSLKVSFVAIFAALILLMPVIARVSRNIYINIFVSYDPTQSKR